MWVRANCHLNISSPSWWCLGAGYHGEERAALFEDQSYAMPLGEKTTNEKNMCQSR